MYVRVYVYVRMYVCTYVYTYVCMYVFVPVWNHFAFLQNPCSVGSSYETRRIQDPGGKGRISNFNFEISTLAGFLGVVVRLRPIPPP